MPARGSEGLPPLIVLAEDDATLRGLLAAVLRRNFSEHEIHTAVDGLEADGVVRSATAQGREVAMVISDLVMPQMDGLELLERTAETCPTASRIILTGAGAMDSAVQSLRMGVDDYLTKPFVEAELVRTIQTHLRAGALQRANARLRAELAYSHRYVSLLLTAVLSRFDERIVDLVDHTSVSVEQRRLALRVRRAIDLIARAYAAEPGATRRIAEYVSLSKVVEGAVRATLQDRDVDRDAFETAQPERNVQVRLDVNSARIALTQLLDNALATGPGSARITIFGRGRNWPPGVHEDSLPTLVRNHLSAGCVAVVVENTAALTRDDEAYIRRVLSGRPGPEDEFRGLGLPLAQLYASLLGGEVVFQWRPQRSEVRFTLVLPSNVEGED